MRTPAFRRRTPSIPKGFTLSASTPNSDAKEEVVFKFRFGDVEHADPGGHHHVQTFKVIRATGADLAGTKGEVLLQGVTGNSLASAGIEAYAGLVPELWAADAFAFFTTLSNLFNEDKYDPTTFEHRENLFQNRNAMAIVLEVPNELIGEGKVGAWATISPCGHAPEVQICRSGYPLIAHLFLSNPATPGLTEAYHASFPASDAKMIGPAIAVLTARLAARASGLPDATAYGQRVAAMLCPSLLPYELGTPAEFSGATFNGRSLTDDAYDVMLSLATNTHVEDGVAPNPARVQADFPYYGEPFTSSEQAGLAPIQGNIGYGSESNSV